MILIASSFAAAKKRITGKRLTAHRTETAGMMKFPDADHRLFNNLFISSKGPEKFNKDENTIYAGGNVYFKVQSVIKYGLLGELKMSQLLQRVGCV